MGIPLRRSWILIYVLYLSAGISVWGPWSGLPESGQRPLPSLT